MEWIVVKICEAKASTDPVFLLQHRDIAIATLCTPTCPSFGPMIYTAPKDKGTRSEMDL